MYNNTTLGMLIDFLYSLPEYGMIRDGFGSPHSDRGAYDELAFSYAENVSVKSMLDNAKSADGETFEGWKGGSYIMDKTTSVYIGEYGHCGDGITPFHFKTWDREVR